MRIEHRGEPPEEKIILEHKDWVRLILGSDGPPPKNGSVYGNVENPYYTKIGQYVGGMVDTWKWDKRAIENLPAEDLKRIYLQIDKGWKEYELEKIKPGEKSTIFELVFPDGWANTKYAQMQDIIVETSDNNHQSSRRWWRVRTNATIEQLKAIDLEYGGDGRFTSTTIKDLQDGCHIMGFIFEHGSGKKSPPKTDGSKTVYIARTGNY